jgi:tryptophan 2,3-dioxygenase
MDERDDTPSSARMTPVASHSDIDDEWAEESGCPVAGGDAAGRSADPSEVLYYWDYLHLDYLLNAQHPRSFGQGSATHDEFLFIVVHQTFELWFKQILFELDSVLEIMGQDPVPERDLATVLSRLRRIIEIQRLFVAQIDVLETMPPLDFFDFRAFLVPASGFQSVQFRLIENKFGLRSANRMKIEGHCYNATLRDDHIDLVVRSEEEPSLCDHVEDWLARTPFLKTDDFDFASMYQKAAEEAHVSERLAIQTQTALDEVPRQKQLRNFDAGVRKFDILFDKTKWTELVQEGKRRFSHEAFMAALFITLYRDEPMLQRPYEILRALVDIDESLTNWRQRHALLAHKMLGRQVGTAGSGYAYLEETARRHKVFGDLFDVPTFFLPRATRPALPATLVQRLDFHRGGD